MAELPSDSLPLYCLHYAPAQYTFCVKSCINPCFARLFKSEGRNADRLKNDIRTAERVSCTDSAKIYFASCFILANGSNKLFFQRIFLLHFL